jgi:hypothetical protein
LKNKFFLPFLNLNTTSKDTVYFQKNPYLCNSKLVFIKIKMSRTNWSDDKLLYRLMHNKSEQSYWDNIQILWHRPSEILFTKCVELSQSDESKNRKIGIDILSQFGFPPRPFLNQSITLYFDMLETENDPNVIQSLLFAIGKNNDTLSIPQIEKLCSFKTTNEESIKQGLVSSIGFISNKNAIDVLIKLSADKCNSIRDWATFYLAQGRRNNKKIRAALWARVADKHQDTKFEAILGLAIRKDKRVSDIIKRILLHGEYSTLLFEAIEELNDKQFLPLLQQNLESVKDDGGINPTWLKDLKECIEKLKNK